MIFNYPELRSARIHGPSGYKLYEYYLPWLRDEFVFRCVYCLKRETWGQVTGEFELDHFLPQSLHREHGLDYLNLVYACRRCNLVKLDQEMSDPLDVLSSEMVSVLPDGMLLAHKKESRRLILQLDLNAPRITKWRVMWMRIVELAGERDRELFLRLVGFPEDLPNLGRLRPPTNSLPGGIAKSWYARRQRGELPETY